MHARLACRHLINPTWVNGEKISRAASCDVPGTAILTRRYRTRHGEIDIVASHGSVLVFVEVKARSTSRFAGPLSAVTPAKQRKLTLMALDYLTRLHTSGVACRFNVVAVAMGAGRPQVEVVTDAFAATGRSR